MLRNRGLAVIAIVLGMLGHAGSALAATCLSNANGNWNAAGTWTTCGGTIPGAGDDVQIRNANTVTIPAGFAAVANSVTFTSTNGAANLTHAAATSTLTVGAGGVTMNPSGNNNPKSWNINAGSATVNGAVALNGTSTNNRPVRIFITTGSLDINGNLTMNAGNALRAVIDMSGGAGNLFIAGSFSFAASDGTLTPGTTSTVTFDSAATPVTVATGSSIAYQNLVIAKGTGNVANAATTGNLTVGGNLTVTSGTFNIPGITAAVTGTTSVSGTLGITSATGTKTFSGAVTVNGTWSNSGNANVTMGAGLSNGGTFTAGNGIYALTGALLNSGTFNAGTGNFSLTGDFTNNGTFNSSTGTFTFNGGAAQSITGTNGGTTTFANLTLSNGNGLTLTGTSHHVTVSTLLTLTTGAITTGANVLYISNGSNIASAGGADFIIGNLRKSVPAAANNRLFEIGAGTSYLPVTLIFASVGTGGDLTVATTAAEHPNLSTSGIDDALDVNRYWTLVGSTIASVSYDAQFTWVAADLDVGADTSLFEMQRFDPPYPAAGTWSSTTTANRTATTIQISGVTGFGDFAVGQPLAAAAGIGRFNAYDTTTAGGAVTGFITTKVAGAAFNVAIVALSNNRKSINTNYKGTVTVELLNASDNSGTLDTSTNCNTSWTVIQTLPNLVFDGSESGRKNITVPENNAWREARFRMTDGGLIGCSTDVFAIRPASFSVSVTDATWDTAGTGRALNNTGASGGNVHKAGRPFTVTVTPSPMSATNYNGDPAIAVGGLTCTLPGGCVNGTLTLGAFSGSGARVSNTADYSEAGAFDLTLEDRFFAVIDAADGTPSDCSAAGRFVCQSPAPAAVGRFVPDRFEFAGPGTPTLLTFGSAACGSRSFTYVGQPFWYAVGARPSATLNAVNATGAVTANYVLNLAASRPAISESYADATAPAAAPLDTAAIGTPTLGAGAGTDTYMASLSGQLSYSRSTTTPVGPFDAAISLTVSASDATDAAVTGNGTITTASPLVFNGGGSGIVFDSGAQFRYGRLRLGNGSGSQLLPLLVPMETQYFTGAPSNAFITNAADSCTSIAAANIELGTYTANLNACETSLTVGAFGGGRSTVLMSPPGSGNNGSVVLTARLESAVAGPTTCVGGASTPVTGADRLYLRGNWTAPAYTENPSGRATFGVYRGADEVMDIRENF